MVTAYECECENESFKRRDSHRFLMLRFSEGLAFCYYKFSCCGYATLFMDVDHVGIRDWSMHQTAAT